MAEAQKPQPEDTLSSKGQSRLYRTQIQNTNALRGKKGMRPKVKAAVRKCVEAKKVGAKHIQKD